jgi:hypothetical protein
MGSWINRKPQSVDAIKEANGYNEYAQAVVHAYASALTHLSEAQIRMILERTDTVEDSEDASS